MLTITRTSLILSLLLTATTMWGQRKYSNEFLAIGVSARAHGMANAQVAFVDDMTAGYWNPAGLTQIQAPFQIGAMHAEWFAGVGKFDFISIAKPLNADKSSAVGLTIIRLGIDDIPYTIRLIEEDGSINYDNVTSFSAADYAVLLSYARKVKIKGHELSLGGNAKIIRRVIGTIGSAWGFGLDFGAQYKVGEKWRFGLMARDVTSTFNAWSFTLNNEEKEVFRETDNEIPESSIEVTRPKFILGGSYTTPLGEKTTLTAALDMDFTTDGQRNVLVSSESFNMDPKFGLEFGYNKFIYLRGGIGGFQESLDDVDGSTKIWTFQPNFGLGIVLGRFTIDYSQTDIGDVALVEKSNIFSLKIDLQNRKKSN